MPYTEEQFYADRIDDLRRLGKSFLFLAQSWKEMQKGNKKKAQDWWMWSFTEGPKNVEDSALVTEYFELTLKELAHHDQED